MKKIYTSILALGLLVGSVGVAGATVLTFDDISTASEGSIGTYEGLTWSNLNYIKKNVNPVSGYNVLAGASSSDYVAYNTFSQVGTVDGTTFDFNGALMSAAWYNGSSVVIEGYDTGGTNLVGSTTVQLWADKATLVTLFFDDIDTLTFTSIGGGTQAYSGLGSGGDYLFAMDNFTINELPVPEPASMFLFGTGLIGLAGVVRKRKKTS